MTRKIYNHCAVIGVDGMGNFNRQAATPNMDRIFANGATSYFTLSMDPTISAENWGAMLLGATPVVHGLTNGWISQNEYANKALPSVFTRLRRAFPDAYLTSVCKWNPINHGIVEHDVDVDMATADNDEQGRILKSAVVEDVCASVVKELKAQHLTHGSWDYLEPHAYEILEHIENRELRSMHIMEG